MQMQHLFIHQHKMLKSDKSFLLPPSVIGTMRLIVDRNTKHTYAHKMPLCSQNAQLLFLFFLFYFVYFLKISCSRLKYAKSLLIFANWHKVDERIHTVLRSYS